MAIGPGSIPADYNYQHLPLDLLEKVGATMQHRQDQAEAETYKLQEFVGNLKSATFDRSFKQKVDQKYFPVLQGITQKIINGDQSYKSDLMKTQAQIMQDPDIQTLNYNYAKENDYLKDRDTYQKDSKYDQIYDARDKFTKGRNQLTPFDYSGMTAKEDYTPHSEDLMKGIASDSKGWEGYSRDKYGDLIINSNGQIRKSDGSVETLTPNKVRQVAQFNVPGFLRGKGGNYFIHSLLGQEASFDQLPNEIKSKVYEAAEEHLYNTGIKYAFNKSKSGEDFQNIPGYNDNKSTGTDITTSNNNILTNPVDLTKEKDYLDNSTFDSKGNISTVPEKRSSLTFKVKDPKNPDGYRAVPVGVQGNLEDVKRQKNAQVLVSQLKANQPGITHEYSKDGDQFIQGKELSDKQILESYIKAKHELINGINKKFNPSPTALDDLTKKFFGPSGIGDIQGRKVSVVKEDGTLTEGKWDLAMEELGYSKSPDPKTFKAARVTGILPISDQPGDFIVSLPDKDGKLRQMLVEGDNESKQIFQTPTEIFKLISQAKDSSIQDSRNPDITYTIKSMIDPITKMFDPVILMQNTKTGEKEQVTIEDIVEAKKRAFMKSGYVGSKLQNQEKTKP